MRKVGVNRHGLDRWDRQLLMVINEWNNLLAMGALDTLFDVDHIEEELYGFFTIQSDVALDTRVGRYISAFTVDDNFHDTLFLDDWYLSPILFFGSFGK